MEIFFRVTLFLAGIINLIPSILAIFPGRIYGSYGVDILDPNMELLLRHRAVLFFIVGGILVYSALAKKYYALATITGLVSMVSFVVLYLSLSQSVNEQLRKVMLFDIVASTLLFVGALVYFLFSGKMLNS